MLSSSRPGVSLDYDILSLNIAKPAQFLEQRDKAGDSCFSQFSYRGRRVNDGNVIDLRRLPRLRTPCRGRDQQTGYELPPPHLPPLWLVPSSYTGSVGFRTPSDAERIRGLGPGVAAIAARTCATARPQLAKVETAFQGASVVNRLNLP